MTKATKQHPLLQQYNRLMQKKKLPASRNLPFTGKQGKELHAKIKALGMICYKTDIDAIRDAVAVLFKVKLGIPFADVKAEAESREVRKIMREMESRLRELRDLSPNGLLKYPGSIKAAEDYDWEERANRLRIWLINEEVLLDVAKSRNAIWREIRQKSPEFMARTTLEGLKTTLKTEVTLVEDMIRLRKRLLKLGE